MNILLMVNHLDLGGAEHFVVGLANTLVQRGHAVVVLSEGGALEPLLEERVVCVKAPTRAKGPAGMLRVIGKVRGLVAEHSIDLLHTNSTNTALAARLAGPGRPIVASGHGIWSAWKMPMVARVLAWSADHVVGCADFITRDLVRHGLAPGRARTIHNGIALPAPGREGGGRAEVRRELGVPEGAPLVIAVGRAAPQKGFDTLLEALPAVREAVPAVRFVIAGSGPSLPALERQAARLGLGGTVSFLGYRRDVARLLTAADCYCQPSLAEGLPLATAEAMAAGLAVVATPVGGLPELVRDGQTGRLVPPRDPEALAAALIGLLRDEAGRSRMGEAGRERAAAGFSLALMVDRFEALYRECLAAGAFPRRGASRPNAASPYGRS